MTNDQIIDAVLRFEGGYVDHPDDPGGATNRGITLASWRRYTGKPTATKSQLRALTDAQIRRFYLDEHIVRPGFAAIEYAILRWLVVDSGVLHGVGDAARFVQTAIGGLAVDGIFGPKSRAAVNAAPVVRTYVGVCAARMIEEARVLTLNPRLITFYRGWTARTASFVRATPLP